MRKVLVLLLIVVALGAYGSEPVVQDTVTEEQWVEDALLLKGYLDSLDAINVNHYHMVVKHVQEVYIMDFTIPFTGDTSKLIPAGVNRGLNNELNELFQYIDSSRMVLPTQLDWELYKVTHRQ